MFQMPDQVRHDDFELFTESSKIEEYKLTRPAEKM